LKDWYKNITVLFKQMRLSRNTLIAVGAIIIYIAFFSNPPPSHIQNFLESPVGHMVMLLLILYTAAYQSLIVAVFLGIAYIMTARRVTEYMDEKQQSPEGKETPAQPKSEGVPPPSVTGAMKDLLKKGDTRLPQSQGKNVSEKPAENSEPKPSTNTQIKESFTQSFSSF